MRMIDDRLGVKFTCILLNPIQTKRSCDFCSDLNNMFTKYNTKCPRKVSSDDKNVCNFN